MKQLMKRWNIEKPWEVIVILFVFSITGSTSIAAGRPLLKATGITLDNFHPIIYYPLFILLSFVLYQIFLVTFGWLFGQYQFFWTMEKKMLKRFRINL